jgi:HlyD family secretion protein
LKHQLFFGVALALVIVLAACTPIVPFAPTTKQPAAGIDPSRKVTVTKGNIDQKVIAPGKLIARANATVVFPVSSQVLTATVKEGDLVQAGQPLAILDTSELELAAQQARSSYVGALAAYSMTLQGPNATAVKAARAALTAAQASYADIRSDPSPNELAGLNAALANAEAALRSAQSAYDQARRENPAGIGGAPESLALEQATNNYNAAKAAYARALEKPKPGVIASLASQVTAAQANLDALLTSVVTETVIQAKARVDQSDLAWQQAQQVLRKAVVVAPINGMVISIAFRKGDTVLAGARALDLADFAIPIFEANVDEADFGGVRMGQEADVTLQTFPDQTFKANVEAVAPIGSATSNVVTFKVLLRVSESNSVRPGEGIALLPGMSGKSELVVASARDVIVIPTSLMASDPDTGEYSVKRVLPGDKVETVKVQVGLRDDTESEIKEGLQEGDVLLMPEVTGNADGTLNATATPSVELVPGGGGVGGAP